MYTNSKQKESSILTFFFSMKLGSKNRAREREKGKKGASRNKYTEYNHSIYNMDECNGWYGKMQNEYICVYSFVGSKIPFENCVSLSITQYRVSRPYINKFQNVNWAELKHP